MWDAQSSNNFSRRERQVIEIIMRLGSATGREIEQELPDAPTYSAVRSILRLLVEKGHLIKKNKAGRDHYQLPVAPAKARLKALQQIVRTLFDNSPAEAAIALLSDKKAKLTKGQAAELTRLIRSK